jgi:hypothetical protein
MIARFYFMCIVVTLCVCVVFLCVLAVLSVLMFYFSCQTVG